MEQSTLRLLVDPNKDLSDTDKEKVAMIEDIVAMGALINARPLTTEEFDRMFDLSITSLERVQELVMEDVAKSPMMREIQAKIKSGNGNIKWDGTSSEF